MQVVLRLDFIQTAVIRKEEIIHTLYERGELKAEVCKPSNFTSDLYTHNKIANGQLATGQRGALSYLLVYINCSSLKFILSLLKKFIFDWENCPTSNGDIPTK